MKAFTDTQEQTAPTQEQEPSTNSAPTPTPMPTTSITIDSIVESPKPGPIFGEPVAMTGAANRIIEIKADVEVKEPKSNSGKKAEPSTKTKNKKVATPQKKPAAPKRKRAASSKVTSAPTTEKETTAIVAKNPRKARVKKLSPIQIQTEETSIRFGQLLSQFSNTTIQTGQIPEEWETNIELELEPLLRTLRPGVVTFTKTNKVAIDCPVEGQREFLKEIFRSTDPKQPGKPTTNAAGFLKHFSHIARAATQRKNGMDALQKLIKVGEICCAYLELLEQLAEPESRNKDRTLDLQVMGAKATIIGHNVNAGKMPKNGNGAQNQLALLPTTGEDTPMQMMMIPDSNGNPLKIVCINPQFSVHYQGEHPEKVLQNQRGQWKKILLWIGIGMIIQTIIAIAIL